MSEAAAGSRCYDLYTPYIVVFECQRTYNNMENICKLCFVFDLWQFQLATSKRAKCTLYLYLHLKL